MSSDATGTSLFLRQHLPEKYSYLAPDGSEIRMLLDVAGAGVAHCRLPPGCVSSPVKHKSVNEIWYILSGSGQIWQGRNGLDDFADLSAGVCLTIAAGDSFQFKNTGMGDLDILITTAPNWPGPDEAVPVSGYWKVAREP